MKDSVIVLKGSESTELQSTSRLRDRRARSLSENMSSLGWLSNSIVHDLRNPVATICAGTEMLMKADATPTEVKRLATNVHGAACRIRELLAEVSFVTYGKKSRTEICDLGEIITAASEAASAAAYDRTVQVLLDVPAKIELPLERSRVERVFFNVITNAVEAISGGGEIRIKVRSDSNWALVEIEDTGPGIPFEIRDRIFEPFVTVGKTNGLGLGLALSRRAILDQGGDMWLEAAPGARIVIRFPLNADEGS